MSETKFTPGKWYVENGVPGKPRIFSSAKNLLTPIVCECIGARSRRKHDAALISAAPEMYEQLKRHCALCMLMHPDCEGCEICDTGKVLKKARGEE